LDGVGLKDVISGSAPGEIYWFRRLDDGTFAANQKLKDCHGVPILVSSRSAAHAADWNSDGHMDLLVGTGDGKVYFVPRESGAKTLTFRAPIALELQHDREKMSSAAPGVADWDGDGRNDLVLGAGDGSVYWYRNVGTAEDPKLAAGQCLIPQSPMDTVNDDRPTAGAWGTRARPCVADWNGDGRLDLLIGDCCGRFEAKPFQNPEELAEEMRAIEQLPLLRRQWAEAFAQYRNLLQVSRSGDTSDGSQDKLRNSLNRVQQLKVEIAWAQDTIKRYEPQRQTHGFVWLFLRKSHAQERSSN
jgi:hypothetical protein